MAKENTRAMSEHKEDKTAQANEASRKAEQDRVTDEELTEVAGGAALQSSADSRSRRPDITITGGTDTLTPRTGTITGAPGTLSAELTAT